MKKILRNSFLVAIILIAQHPTANAQPITSEQIKAQMVADWQRAKTYTVAYIKAMPANKYSFHPVDSIKRTFAQQMLHLATGNILLMSKATDATPPSFFGYDIEDGSSSQSKDSVMYYVTASYDYCINAVKNSDVNKWGETIEGPTTRFAFMNKAFEHQTHHRGQCTIYIRLQGIRPPGEMLF
ncbi:MAG TPA: DinB family protein [Hanamia sp.]